MTNRLNAEKCPECGATEQTLITKESDGRKVSFPAFVSGDNHCDWCGWKDGEPGEQKKLETIIETPLPKDEKPKRKSRYNTRRSRHAYRPPPPPLPPSRPWSSGAELNKSLCKFKGIRCLYWNGVRCSYGVNKCVSAGSEYASAISSVEGG